MSAEDLSQYIKTRLKELNLTTTAAAERSGVSRQTWHKLINADIVEARLSTLIRVADALEIHTMTMLKIYFHGQPLTHTTTKASGSRKFASGFVADITYPDNSIVQVGQQFEKVWEIANLGTESWVGWSLHCVDEHLDIVPKEGKTEYSSAICQYGLIPLVSQIDVPTTHPNERVKLAVKFQAPALPCSVMSHWKLVNAQGELVFPHLSGLYCMVRVVSL